MKPNELEIGMSVVDGRRPQYGIGKVLDFEDLENITVLYDNDNGDGDGTVDNTRPCYLKKASASNLENRKWWALWRN